ncbi:MAG: hypothetical protein RLZZ127_2023, partial [Planctomycetota bacterium]
MPSSRLAAPATLLALAATLPAGEAWSGWRRFEVVRIDDGATEIQVAAPAGATAAVVVNRRQSRIDLLRIGRGATPAASATDPAAVNRIPLPP